MGGSLFGLMEGYGSLCTVRGSFLGSRVVFGFSYFIPVFVFVLLGPRAQLSSLFGFPSHPSPPFAQVSEEGGLGWIGVGDWRKVPLLERLGGKGVFVFLLFKYPSHPSPPFAQVSEEGGLGWIGVGDWRKVPLLERLGGKGVFVFFCLSFVFVFMFVFCFVVVFFWVCFCSVLCVVGVV